MIKSSKFDQNEVVAFRKKSMPFHYSFDLPISFAPISKYNVLRASIFLMLLGILTCLGTNGLYAQSDTTFTDHYRKDLDLAEIDFLYSYYEQDGDHSPVTGGQGTEHLTDHVGQIVVTIPYKNNKFTLLAGVDHYTSASTDKVNPATVSSASVVDDRLYYNVGWDKIKERYNFGFNTGFSTEWDVNSLNVGGNIGFNDKYNNNQFTLSAQYYRDRWSLIHPIELRNLPEYPKGSDIRNIYDVSATWSTVINTRLQAALTAQIVYQKGLLATPFHRVYLADQTLPDIERLPRQRLKIPLSLRLNYYINETFVLRSFYRYYQDDFDINGHTAFVEVPIKVRPKWTLTPFYRWHTQTASKYFAPIYAHTTEQTHYTSDFDLSAFSSSKYGMAFRYSPVGGIFDKKIPVWKFKGIQLKKIEARAAYFNRTDGLNAWIASIGFKFLIY